MCVLFILAAAGNISAQDSTLAESADPDGNGQEILCLPGAYLVSPDTCNPLGPSEYLTDYVKDGGLYPAPPFPGKKTDPELSKVPYKYARINAEQQDTVYLYNSPDEAAYGGTPLDNIPSGTIRYVSYTDTVDIEDRHYVRTRKDSLWLRASPAEVSPKTFGRTFSKTPEYEFGWIVESCSPYLEADYNKGKSSVYYNREDIVNLYETIETKDTTWFRIGKDQWVDSMHFRAVHFDTTPPEEIESDRWIEIDLSEQVLMAYENNELVFAALISTGANTYNTRPGIFQIFKKNESETMTGAFEKDRSDYYRLEDVPFSMYFDGKRTIHGTYWRAWFGYPQSHGCINMSIGDAHWLYNWSELKDWVYVHDSSEIVPDDSGAEQEDEEETE